MRPLSLLFLAALLTHPSSLLAQPSEDPPILLSLDPCTELSAGGLRSMLSLELDRAVVLRESRQQDAIEADVTCEKELLRIRIRNSRTQRSLTRTLDPSSTSRRGRTRLLSLALAEQIEASEVTFVEKPTRTEPIVIEKKPAARTPPEQSVTGLTLSAGSVGQAVQGAPGVSLGLHAALLHSFSSWLAWSLDVQSLWGTWSASLGQVQAHLLSGALALELRKPWDELSIHAGLGLRLARIALEGEPGELDATQGFEGTSLWGGPLLLTRLQWSPWSPIGLELGVQSGWSALTTTVLVEDRPEIRLHGLWIAATLGVCVRWL